MTDKIKALNALLAKVESGDIPDTGVNRFGAIPKCGGGVYSDPNWYDAHAAYWRGDSNAAEALHGRVLPGWEFDIKDECILAVRRSLVFSAKSTTTARARLITILKVLIFEAVLKDKAKPIQTDDMI
tara:strand:+ start:540 stop:920 length:381 start_codon:yes stop_codon:yes gene_type:complete